MYHIARPTPEQLAWQDCELGVLIHYCMEIYNPGFTGYKTAAVRTELPPEIINPTRLDPWQWVRSAYELGAKYAVLVANHCTGFSLWPTAENDYCTRSLRWRDGRGDICREFVDACRSYGIRPGFYYSTGCSGYYDINDETETDYFSPKYREYVGHVERQLTELWTQYGELFEIWFDGGVIPPEKGGPDILPLLRKYQPHAVCFQGPEGHPHLLRWVGNEDGLAPESCWATTDGGGMHFDGTVSDERVGEGHPDGRYYRPAETDMPNRSPEAFGGGWAWREGEDGLVFSSGHLLDCYLRSVGRNSNLLLGMAISRDGDFKDEAQLREFGELLRSTFSNPLCIVSDAGGRVTLRVPQGARARYFVVREDIREGQHIRGFRLLADGREVCRGECVGHKRILPLERLGCGDAREYTFEVTASAGEAAIRDAAVY